MPANRNTVPAASPSSRPLYLLSLATFSNLSRFDRISYWIAPTNGNVNESGESGPGLKQTSNLGKAVKEAIPLFLVKRKLTLLYAILLSKRIVGLRLETAER
jgi:hypothetical protein